MSILDHSNFKNWIFPNSDRKIGFGVKITSMSGVMRSAAIVVLAGVSHAAVQDGNFVHLFEWSWSDVAIECEQWLGPKGK